MKNQIIVMIIVVFLVAYLPGLEAAKIRGMITQKSVPAVNVKVGLVNKQNEEFDPTYTDKDGFYYFDGVNLRERYTLRIWISKSRYFDNPILIQSDITDIPPIAVPHRRAETDTASTSITEEILNIDEVQKFVLDYYAAQEKRQIYLKGICFGDIVDYYQDGLRARAYILAEKRRINKYFSSMHYHLDKVECVDSYTTAIKWARFSFEYDFRAKSSIRKSGWSEQIWQLQKHNGNIQIISCQEKIHREK